MPDSFLIFQTVFCHYDAFLMLNPSGEIWIHLISTIEFSKGFQNTGGDSSRFFVGDFLFLRGVGEQIIFGSLSWLAVPLLISRDLER